MNMDAKLEDLLEAARTRQTTEADREEQRINFAFGNASEDDKKSTKESIRAASVIMSAA
jgi:hypothetical protein